MTVIDTNELYRLFEITPAYQNTCWQESTELESRRS